MLNFLRLTSMILDYLRYTCLLPYLTSIFGVALKVYRTQHCMRQVRLHLIVSCVARSFSNQDSLHIHRRNSLEFYYIKSTYLFIYFVRKLSFLPLLKPLKMNCSEFFDIFERARWYLSCFNGQILLKAGM